MWSHVHRSWPTNRSINNGYIIEWSVSTKFGTTQSNINETLPIVEKSICNIGKRSTVSFSTFGKKNYNFSLVENKVIGLLPLILVCICLQKENIK